MVLLCIIINYYLFLPWRGDMRGQAWESCVTFGFTFGLLFNKAGGLSHYASLRIHFFLSTFPGALQPFYRRPRTLKYLPVI